jgi:hypothetical protein
MTLPDDVVEYIPRQFTSLQGDHLQGFIANHLSTANYAVRPVDTDKKVQAAKDRPFETNSSIWKAILSDRLRRTDIEVVLDGFFIFEWLPRSPGLFITPQGTRARAEAHMSIESIQGDVIVYSPYGKASMLDAGVGNIRLKPIKIGGSDFYFMSASSSGVCHEGLPVAMPSEYRDEYINKITARGAVFRKLVGQLRFIPEKLTPLYKGYAGVPQVYLEVQKVLPATHQPSEEIEGLSVSVAVSFSSSFEGVPKSYACYVSFDPGEPGSLRQGVEWMEQEYVIGKYQGKIITDFDQQKAHFATATFSLDKVMNRTLKPEEVGSVADDLGLNSEEILEHQSQVTISIGEYYAGSKYNISGEHVDFSKHYSPVVNINQPPADADKPKPPDSLGQAFIHSIWPINSVWKYVLLSVAIIVVGGYFIWSSLPEATKLQVLSIFQREPRSAPLTPEQDQQFRFNVSMAQTEERNSKPYEALYYYQKALELKPQDTELKKKVDALQESIAKGASR